jgi:MSHA biogenesis protein MshO
VTHRTQGFTLIEVVVVIALSAIVAGFSAVLIRQPLLAYNDVAQRRELVVSAETALERLARDVRRALPNSLRVSPSGRVIEYLDVSEGARYRSEADAALTHPAPSDVLEIGAETSFNVLGRLGALTFTYDTALPAGTRLAVYPTSTSLWNDAASGASPGVITPASTSITPRNDGNEDQLTLSAPHQFSLLSPRKRVFVVTGPVTYACVPGAGTLTRYWSYTVNATQPTDPTLAPLSSASSARLAERVSSCSFDYQPGTPQRGSLLTISLTLTSGAEQVQLLHQVHVENVP